MMRTRLHVFSNGRTHVAYDPDKMTFYRLTDQAWADHRAADQLAEGGMASPDRPVPVSAGDGLERLVLVVTTECNLRCRYCYLDEECGMPGQKMSGELARRALDWALELFSLVGVLQFFGGEPALNYPTIQAACEMWATRQASGRLERQPLYGLVTNGTLLPERLIELAHQYRIHLTYSIDGPPEIHDSHRVYADNTGSFQSMMANFERIRREHVGGLGVEMTFTPEASQAGYGIWELAQFSQNELGVIEPHIAPVSSVPGGPSWLDRLGRVSASYRTAAQAALHSLLDGDYVGFTLLSGILRTLITRHPRPFICPAGVGTLAIDPRGDIYPCFMFIGQSQWCLGNVHHPPARSTLDGRRQRFVQANFKHTHVVCRACWARNLCTGCLGDTLASRGALQGGSPVLCAISQAVAEEVMLFLASLQTDARAWKRFVQSYAHYRLDEPDPHALA